MNNYKELCDAFDKAFDEDSKYRAERDKELDLNFTDVSAWNDPVLMAPIKRVDKEEFEKMYPKGESDE